MNCKEDCMSCILSLYFSQQTVFHSRSLTDLKGLLKQRENKNKNKNKNNPLAIGGGALIMRAGT